MHSVAPGTEIREYSIAANRSTKELTNKITEDTQNSQFEVETSSLPGSGYPSG